MTWNDVAVTPDGTVLLWSGYHETDRDVHPGLDEVCLCSSGHSGSLGCPSCPTFTASLCRKRRALACICVDTPEGVGTIYLAGTLINEVVVAPDGTIWAVGDYDGEGGGLYRITHERLTTN